MLSNSKKWRRTRSLRAVATQKWSFRGVRRRGLDPGSAKHHFVLHRVRDDIGVSGEVGRIPKSSVRSAVARIQPVVARQILTEGEIGHHAPSPLLSPRSDRAFNSDSGRKKRADCRRWKLAVPMPQTRCRPGQVKRELNADPGSNPPRQKHRNIERFAAPAH